MFQKFAIKLFKLQDLRQLYLSERRKQRTHDENEFHHKFKSLQEKHDRTISLMEQSYEVEIQMLKEEIRDFKNREKEIEKREYLNKMNQKKNLTDASIISTKLIAIGKFFSKEGFEIERILDDADVKKLLSE